MRKTKQSSAVLYPGVVVQLTGEDGNAFSIIARVGRALRREIGREAESNFKAAALACGSYDELLQLCMKTVDVH